MVIGISALMLVLGLAACADTEPSVAPNNSAAPALGNICRQVNIAVAAITYFSEGQPPPTRAQLESAAVAVDKAKATAPKDQQALLTQLASDLRVLATTPPGQRDASQPGKDFAAAYTLFAQVCQSANVVIKTASPSS